MLLKFLLGRPGELAGTCNFGASLNQPFVPHRKRMQEDTRGFALRFSWQWFPGRCGLKEAPNHA